MSRKAHNNWVVLAPPFPGHEPASCVFRDHAARLSNFFITDEETDFDTILDDSLIRINSTNHPTALRAALCLLTDLARQRWSIRITQSGNVEVKQPVGDCLDITAEKTRIRAQELVKRDEQLREPTTRKFVMDMEKMSSRRGHFTSIFSLIRDGRELADSFRAARALPLEERTHALKGVVDPYLQFVNDADYCELTGFRLMDIWRYFRHTWTNQYTSTPGRSMAFLVRDRSREFNPIIGIGALGSPIVQIRERDAWIGWQPEAFMEFISESPTEELGLWLYKTVEAALGEIYIDDFIEEQLLTPADVRSPTKEVLKRLTEHGKKQRELHHRLASLHALTGAARRDENNSTKAHWQARARTHLYRSKRALSLADMLLSRMVLQKYLSIPPKLAEVRDLFASTDGLHVVKKVLRKAKADRVGIAMADITVCGAIAPYTPILGGKLVSMLMASPEVVTAYRNKYLGQESEIASSMAGRPIVRPSKLVFLGTTSLYGVGSSQYNRLRMPAERLGGKPSEHLAYLEIGKSDAYGTSHFSSNTVDALVALVQQSSNGQRVNSIFGEGVSPKLRKIREGLDALNFPTDTLLQHGRQRIIYGIPLVRNLREFLIGMDDDPDYIFDMCAPKKSTAEITNWWIERWLSRRIESDDVLTKVEQHTLVRPVRHGARVVLPHIDEGQNCLFDDLVH